MAPGAALTDERRNFRGVRIKLCVLDLTDGHRLFDVTVNNTSFIVRLQTRGFYKVWI